MIKNITGRKNYNYDISNIPSSNYKEKHMVIEYMTADDSSHVAYAFDPSDEFKITNNYRILINVTVNACREESEASADYFRFYAFTKQGTNSLTRTTAYDISTREANTDWDFTIAANTTNTTIDFTVKDTQPSGYTEIRWHIFADIKCIKIYPAVSI